MISPLESTDRFVERHIGPDEGEISEMLRVLEVGSLDELIDQTVPRAIRTKRPLELPAARSEMALIEELEAIAAKNQPWRSFIGQGYHDTFAPGVILRNILTNPGWYTQYTPYQAEISQGRLEALLNFQTMISDLTGLEVANASMLDEGTAAAEAMAMVRAAHGGEGRAFFVSDSCHPQTIEVVRTRAWPLGLSVLVGDHRDFDFPSPIFGALVQYPATDGAIHDYRGFIERVRQQGARVVMAADPLALTLLTPPGELGADVAVGSVQRFGLPMGYGGPHAAYLATRAELVRQMPGRIIGVSQDASGRTALRMALQTREQHIRRERATSNICTSQVLLAVMASMYAVYHGPEGLTAIASRIRALTSALARGLSRLGFVPRHQVVFDTLRIETTPEKAREIHAGAAARQIDFRQLDERTVGVSLDETTTAADLENILAAFSQGRAVGASVAELAAQPVPPLPEPHARRSRFLTHPIFHRCHSETEMQRYIRSLEQKDLSLTASMIPLGSCTMKLNAATELAPLTWPRFSRMHPFAPAEQAAGYQVIFRQLEAQLAEITGLAAVSLQPNAGSQGEYAGLLVIRRYHQSRGEGLREVVLIPQSAHGTNPASATLAGYRVVVVKTDERGNVDLADLRARAQEHREQLAALMVTYPSTHGVFEEEIREICSLVHQHGGQVYLDGANMNAMVGLCRPGELGADVCHLNLHKTFAIPHGGGGPGVGPIAVAQHLRPFLPGHPMLPVGGEEAIGPVSAAPYGSASILLISWAYIALMGPEGLARASKVAILNANYLAKRLDPHYPVLYRGARGRVAHECIVDPRALKRSAGVEVDDIAKRLMDYGFHAPTVSFPVAGTLMIEPTESEPKGELDRFVEAMLGIRAEIREIEEGRAPREDNLLKGAPHPAQEIASDEWSHPYSRARAAFPTEHTRGNKHWPSVGRVNNTLGDRKLVCSCPPVETYERR